MLSGYATGGILGLPLAAALVGLAVASFVVRTDINWQGALGAGVVGLFALLVMGNFFGRLTTLHAVLLMAAPLVCWLPALPVVRRTRPWLRAVACLILVALPVSFTVVQASRSFAKDVGPSHDGAEPSIDDYANFGR
jgi:hypothetical protein